MYFIFLWRLKKELWVLETVNTKPKKNWILSQAKTTIYQGLSYYTTVYNSYTGCSERRLIGHSFYRRNFLRKCCATCQEKCRRAAPRTEKSDKPAAAFFSGSGAALSQEVPTVK
jgi:hypothetical protein